MTRPASSSIAIRSTTATILSASTLGGIPIAAHADPGDQTGRLTASDGMQGPSPFIAGDRFGASVAIGSGMIVVGATQSESARFPREGTTGVAYLFDASTGEELRKLTPSDGMPSDGIVSDTFGESVAIDDGLVLVGSPRHDGQIFDSNRGAAYLYDAATGQELAKLEPQSTTLGDNFGSSVAIGGGVAAVAARRDRELGQAAGAVYLFDVSEASEPIFLSKIVAPDGGQGHQFGSNTLDTPGQGIALDGDTLVVGAPGDSEVINRAGAVYVYNVSDPANPVLVHKLRADDAAEIDGLGNSVAIDDGRIIAGALRNDQAGTVAGAAYVFDATTGEQLHKLLGNDTDTSDLLGFTVSIHGLVGVAGTHRQAFSYGVAYAFNMTTGEQLAKLEPTFARSGDRSGWAAAAGEGIVAVGADQAYFDVGLVAGPGYVATFDASYAPPPCPADLNDDGTVDANDFFEYLDLFSAGDPAADLTGPSGDPDGVLDADDFFQFLNLFAAGCP